MRKYVSITLSCPSKTLHKLSNSALANLDFNCSCILKYASSRIADWQKHSNMYCTNPYWWNPFVCRPKKTLNANFRFNPFKELKDNSTEKNTYCEVLLMTWFYFLHCPGYKLYIDFIFYLLSYILHAFFVDDLRIWAVKYLYMICFKKYQWYKCCASWSQIAMCKITL